MHGNIWELRGEPDNADWEMFKNSSKKYLTLVWILTMKKTFIIIE